MKEKAGISRTQMALCPLFLYLTDNYFFRHLVQSKSDILFLTCSLRFEKRHFVDLISDSEMAMHSK